MVTHDAPLSYTITTAPIQGTVTVNQSGWFSYAPTDAARFRAGLSPVTDTDSFTVIVNDGHGGVTPVVVTGIPISTTHAAVTDNFTVGSTHAVWRSTPKAPSPTSPTGPTTCR